MLAEEIDYALGRGIVEKPFEVLSSLSRKLFAPGEEIVLIGSKGGFGVVRIVEKRSGQLRAVIHREVSAFPCER
jgi:hypothetical protein